MARRVTVLGGAGFLGSHIVERFVRRGDRVVVVDGLVPGTGGRARHLDAVRDAIEFRQACLEDVADLEALISRTDLVVDCLAWTAHIGALADPLRDMRLNLESHVRLLEVLRRAPGAAVVYLGTRSQYGKVRGRLLDDTPMWPNDVQGIHKAAAEHHYRVSAGLWGLNVVSLRLPNCFGERQPVRGDDIGLVGGFIRSALAGETVTVFGRDRRRGLLYARDAAAIVERLADAPWEGFVGLNAGGTPVAIHALAEQVVAAAGRGAVAVEPVPAHVQAIESGDADVDESGLAARIGPIPRTDLEAALGATVAFFKETGQ